MKYDEKKRVVKLSPDLRSEKDPELGELAPIRTNFFCKVYLDKSTLHSEIGFGLFAGEAIVKDTVICIGGGQITSEISKAPPEKDFSGVFDESFFITPIDYDQPTMNWYTNHSCDPNLKIIGRLILVACKDIDKDEELTIDYGVISAGDNKFEMNCKCGAFNCRKVISGADWKNKDLFNRYYVQWPPFIQRLGVLGHAK